MNEIRELLEKFYYIEGGVTVYLDATHPEVELPQKFKNDTSFTLSVSKYSLLTRQSIKFKDDYVSMRHFFDAKIHQCKIPYNSIRKHLIQPHDIDNIKRKNLEKYCNNVENAVVLEQETERGFLRVSLLEPANFIEIHVSGNDDGGNGQVIYIGDSTLNLLAKLLTEASKMINNKQDKQDILVT